MSERVRGSGMDLCARSAAWRKARFPNDNRPADIGNPSELPVHMRWCTEACEVWPECSTCHRTKAPKGRSLPLEMVNGYCSYHCRGYLDQPAPGHLFPGELARERGEAPA